MDPKQALEDAEQTYKKFCDDRGLASKDIKAMMADAQELIKFVRQMQNLIDGITAQNEEQEAKREKLAEKLESLKQFTRRSLAQIPSSLLINSSKPDAEKLLEATTKLMESLKQIEEERDKLQKAVDDETKNADQLRNGAKDMEKMLVEAETRLRIMASDETSSKSIAELIAIIGKILDDDKRTATELDKALEDEKKVLNKLLAERRELLELGKKLFINCSETNKATTDLELDSSDCPQKLDESQSLGNEYDRGIAWLIEHVGHLIDEVQAAKVATAEAEKKRDQCLREIEQLQKQTTDEEATAEQLQSECEKLKQELAANNERLNKLKADADKAEKENQNAIEATKRKWSDEKARLQKAIEDFKRQSQQLRQALDNLSTDCKRQNDENAELMVRIDQSATELTELQEKADEKTKTWDDTLRKQEQKKSEARANLNKVLLANKESESDVKVITEELRIINEQIEQRNKVIDENGQAIGKRRELAEKEAEKLKTDNDDIKKRIKDAKTKLMDQAEKNAKLCEEYKKLEDERHRLEMEHCQLVCCAVDK